MYQVTDSSVPTLLQDFSGPDWVTVGTQIWAKSNLNVGTMVNVGVAQTNNSTIEKYCYMNSAAMCTTYGGLYNWDEAMQYDSTEGGQGICSAGSHIPTDAEWKILEMSLSGMSQATADGTLWRGTDEGTKLKSGGSSGLNMLLAGIYNYTLADIFAVTSNTFLWSSSVSDGKAWGRDLHLDYSTVYRGKWDKAFGYSVRCLAG
jgi:uncharacterized protein (TIGR02145 family)